MLERQIVLTRDLITGDFLPITRRLRRIVQRPEASRPSLDIVHAVLRPHTCAAHTPLYLGVHTRASLAVRARPASILPRVKYCCRKWKRRLVQRTLTLLSEREL